jgi:hypothetical protein
MTLAVLQPRTASARVRPAPLRAGEPLAADAFSAIRTRLLLHHCKWDPQVEDVSTLAPFPLFMARGVWTRLRQLAETLTGELLAAERELVGRPELHRVLRVPRVIRRALRRGDPPPVAVRVMRFDFHWTDEGWRISEVRGHRLTGHTGQTAGFTSANFRYPDHGLTVTGLTNTGETGNGGLMAARIAKFYIPSMSLAVMKPVADGDVAKTQKAMRALISRLENKSGIDLMTPALVQSVSTPNANRVNQRIAGAGLPKTLALVGTEKANGKTIYLYRADSGKRLSLWRLSFDAAGLIDEMTLEEEE